MFGTALFLVWLVVQLFLIIFFIFSQFCSILFLKIVLGGINELQNTELKRTEK